MKRLRIILDCDGVLADTVKKVLLLYNNEYGLNFKREDIVTWDMCKIQKPGTNLTKYFTQKGFFRNLEPMKDAQKYAKALKEDGHELFVATASPLEGLEDKLIWLRENYEFIPQQNIIFAERKDLLSADIILDDGLHNLVNSQCRFKVVFDQPWNREDNNFLRVYNWEEFYRLVCQIEQAERRKRRYV